jgi:hypothetical protein
MAIEVPGHPKAPVSAAADLSTKQYRFVKLTGRHQVNVCSGATDAPYGVLQDKPASGVAADVMTRGITKVIAGGTIAAGDRIGTDANGAAVKLTEGTDTTKYIVGVALHGRGGERHLQRGSSTALFRTGPRNGRGHSKEIRTCRSRPEPMSTSTRR